jgi:hypothetical protein
MQYHATNIHKTHVGDNHESNCLESITRNRRINCRNKRTVFAQDEGEEDDPLGLYADVPQTRGEDGALCWAIRMPPSLSWNSDYLCGHCQDYHETVTQFIEEYVVTGQAKFEYRLCQSSTRLLFSTMAATTECADAGRAFWPAYAVLYDLATSGELTADFPDVVASHLNLNQENMSACLDEMQTRTFQYETDYALGVELDVTGTPAIRVQVGDAPIGAPHNRRHLYIVAAGCHCRYCSNLSKVKTRQNWSRY